MKLPGSKFWGIIALSFASLLVITASSAVWFKSELSTEELDYLIRLLERFIGPVLIVAFLFLAVCIWSLESVYRDYIRPIPKLAG
jgi:hypothetical protein